MSIKPIFNKWSISCFIFNINTVVHHFPNPNLLGQHLW